MNDKFCPNPECGARLPHHHPFCDAQDSVTQIAALKAGYSMLSKDLQHQRERSNRAWREVTFWQGKFAIIVRENNALRKSAKRSGK